ncbi:N5-carboxyaminoimidazole ribonucleotide synthase [Methylocella tundrae]|jgi:5-(carboxyamino)imidazole ribonucleotide synthase|uniref:N5-carboxyaminoimidazole ribonucleotide synthase n=1 Tax=Methylocella tundrae TaxID=227605 RepID=A0A4U8Z2A2_METTU|nr:5-(carboxyamino)imidazole ribonucleotide synthase [Methylocella tundrae]WPP03419.1 5-(carboxyamino)imidazole ribonucleotide synthase [Methylocella tundrae]VFU09481.1 N5-carboxyaminoimidazole ribonucleotide synthase [Methylocella tundrae]VTZ48249.1 N5-carboxyaminoimidazole ribonucleotide synthase [Methylocella tundrae]
MAFQLSPGSFAPGARVGILGGGQLGRMLAMAAAGLGLKAHIFAPEPDSPAFDVCVEKTVAAYEDEAALAFFAANVDVITYEFENVPARTAALLSDLCLVRPSAAALAACQDRLVEKEFLADIGIPTAAYMRVDDAGSMARAVAQLGRPSILKTRRFGYDGKGQVLVREGADLAVTFRSLGGGPAILEAIVPFAKEVSVVAARGADGAFAAYDVCENRHENHILKVTRAPARISPGTAAEAVELTRAIAEALDYVGVIAVEMFVVEQAGGGEQLRVNEIAPRVHNSGHWTLDGSATSQFEQHIRAIVGWPLGATWRHGETVEMENLIGEEVFGFERVLREPGASLHLYGKAEARAGRKMGHVTRVAPGHKA